MYTKREVETTDFKAIVSAHIYLNDKGHEEIEILTQIDNDELRTDIFCDIEDALLEQIDIGGSTDWYFIAIVNSKFIKEDSYWDGIQYDVEHEVTEINKVEDIN